MDTHSWPPTHTHTHKKGVTYVIGYPTTQAWLLNTLLPWFSDGVSTCTKEGGILPITTQPASQFIHLPLSLDKDDRLW